MSDPVYLNLGTEDMIRELEDRGIRFNQFNEVKPEDLEQLFVSLKLGNESGAIEVARKIASDYKGMIL